MHKRLQTHSKIYLITYEMQLMKLIRTPLPMKLYLQKSPKRSSKTINKKQLIDYNYHDILGIIIYVLIY